MIASSSDPSAASIARRAARRRAVILPFVRLAIFAVALSAVSRVVREYRYADIARALTAVPWPTVFLAAALAMAGYAALIGYDYLAFRFLGRPLGLRSMLVPSFVAWAVSNSAPASAITAGGVRYRMYAGVGLTAGDAAVVAAFNVVTYLIGLVGLVGVILVVHPAVAIGSIRGLGQSGRLVGLVLLAAVVGYLVIAARGAGPLTLFGRRFELPSLRIALQQLAISTTDWLVSSAALFVLVSGAGRVGYPDFLAAFLVAQIATQVFFVPGGLGVFEAAILLARPPGASATATLAGLLVYRVLYYLLPLLTAGILIGIQEGLRARAGGQSFFRVFGKLGAMAPTVLAFVTFFSGSILLLTGAIPTDQRRLVWLADLLPLAIIETSHFLASVVGAALLILAWGLAARVRAAFRLTQGLFGLGVLLALARSFDLTLGIVLAIGLIALHVAEREFPRADSLLREPLSIGWALSIGAALGLTGWVGWLCYHHDEYSKELWWRFALFGDAPRFVRAMAGMGITTALFAMGRFFAGRAVAAAAPPP